EGDRAHQRHLHGGDLRRPDEIRAQQHADVGAEDEVVIFVALHLSALRREMMRTAISTTTMLRTHQADMPWPWIDSRRLRCCGRLTVPVRSSRMPSWDTTTPS